MIQEYGYEYDASRDESLWTATDGLSSCGKIRIGGERYDCLRSGRDALKAVAREYAPSVALLPALACQSMITPFELYGHEVRFYRYRQDWSVDLEHLRTLLRDVKKNVLFLYMRYFGRHSGVNVAELKARYPQMVFVEDRTHDLLIQRSEGAPLPDFTVASFRKWASLPDGGLIQARKPLSRTDFEEDLSFSVTRLQAQEMRNEYLRSGDERLKTKYRRIFSELSEVLDRGALPIRMSEYAFQMACGVDWHAVWRQRQENAAALMDALRQIPECALIQETPGLSDLYVPFLTERRDALQARLSAEGIFCTIIWPLRPAQKEVCATARYTAEHMLAAPCDQRYRVEDMRLIGRRMGELMSDA